jgi:hypothetical protein
VIDGRAYFGLEDSIMDVDANPDKKEAINKQVTVNITLLILFSFLTDAAFCYSCSPIRVPWAFRSIQEFQSQMK